FGANYTPKAAYNAVMAVKVPTGGSSQNPSDPSTPSVTTPTTTVTQPPVSEIVKGDADGNGAVTVADVVKVMQHLIGKVTLSGDNAKAADMNDDGKISILDLIKLKNKLL
ncbi:MAG: dockerin type I repeat-containing protein, partial [Oscillospiraceae bacterium]|nr:dockerin type I repeat-containing protein [Oscillospiraceae bacterium]